ALPWTECTCAPGPRIVVVAVPVSSSWPVVRVIVCGVLNRLENSTVSPPPSVFAWRTAARSEPVPLSLVLLTVNVESSSRPSSAVTVGRSRRRDEPRPDQAGKRDANGLRNQDRAVMGGLLREGGAWWGEATPARP